MNTITTLALSFGDPHCDEPDCSNHAYVFVTDVQSSEIVEHDRPAWILASLRATERGFHPAEGSTLRIVPVNSECMIPRDRVLSKDEVTILGFDWEWLAL